MKLSPAQKKEASIALAAIIVHAQQAQLRKNAAKLLAQINKGA